MTRPTVTFSNPNENSELCIDSINPIAVQFSEAMAPATINSLTFTFGFIGESALMSGAIAYDPRDIWIFTPDSPLIGGRTYSARITTGATDLAGNALATDFVWSFAMSTSCDGNR